MYFKELAHTIMEASKYKSAGQVWGLETQGGADAGDQD